MLQAALHRHSSSRFRPFTRAETESSLGAHFERIVRAEPARVAIKTRTQTRSYRELDLHSHGIAHALRRRLAGPPEPVGLLFSQQDANAIAAILGVLRSGHIYLPLDRTQSAERLRETLREAGVRTVLTERGSPKLDLGFATSIEVDDLAEFEEPDAEGERHRPCECSLAPAISPDAAAYIFYTSGSTGRPKGVVDSHRNVLHNVMRYTNALQIVASDRLTLLQPLCFSGSVSSLFCALLNGATVYPFDVAEQGFENIGRWLREEEITIYHSVPAIFRGWVRRGAALPALRVVRLEGDQANKRDVELYRQHLPETCLLAHGLGATETGLSCQLIIDQRASFEGVFPVGQPLPDMEVLIVDEHGEPVRQGMCGEIAVRSPYLALGYWRNPELTHSTFGSDAEGRRTYRSGDLGRMRADGCVEVLGRKDAVGKIHGLRVEAVDVEAALLDLPGVKEAAVATHGNEHGETQLVAYLVPQPGHQVPEARAVRRELLARLPIHMVPGRVVPLARLPLNANGKIDRRALPAPLAAERELAGEISLEPAPCQESLEAELSLLWSQVLGVEGIALDADFFELGGDSLSAARMLAALAQRTGKHVPASSLLRARCLAEFASELRGVTERSLDPALLFFVPSVPGSDLLFAHLSQGVHLHCLQTDWRVLQGDPSVAQIARAYLDELRRVRPHGPYRLAGFCFGGLVAFEMARQLIEQGESISEVALFAVRPSEMRRLISSTLLRREQIFSRWEAIREPLRKLRRLGAKGTFVALKKRLVQRFAPRQGESLEARAARVHRCATRGFRPRPLSAPVAFFIARGEDWIFGKSPEVHLRSLSTRQLVVHRVPGERHTLLQRPHAVASAALLASQTQGAAPGAGAAKNGKLW